MEREVSRADVVFRAKPDPRVAAPTLGSAGAFLRAITNELARRLQDVSKLATMVDDFERVDVAEIEEVSYSTPPASFGQGTDARRLGRHSPFLQRMVSILATTVTAFSKRFSPCRQSTASKIGRAHV